MSEDSNEKLLKELETNAEPLLTFPCDFLLKVVGLNTPDFVEQVSNIIKKHDPEVDLSKITKKESANGKYLSISVTVHALSQEWLDALYKELVDHPLTKFVL